MSSPDIDLGNGIVYTSNYETLKTVSNIKTITIVSQCQYIGESAFYGSRTSLTSFNFGSDPKLKQIKESAFSDCVNLQTIDLSQCTQLETISKNAFYHCTAVSSLILPSSIKILDQYCFSLLFNLKTNVQIPNSLTTFGEGVFDQTNISGIDFETGIHITQIPRYSLRLTKISKLKIPASVTTFLPSSLEGVPLQTIEVETEDSYKVESNVLLSKDQNNTEIHLLLMKMNYHRQLKQ